MSKKQRFLLFLSGFIKKLVKNRWTKMSVLKNYAHKILKQTSKFEKYGHKE
jgi:hypothetical protein